MKYQGNRHCSGCGASGGGGGGGILGSLLGGVAGIIQAAKPTPAQTAAKAAKEAREFQLKMLKETVKAQETRDFFGSRPQAMGSINIGACTSGCGSSSLAGSFLSRGGLFG